MVPILWIVICQRVTRASVRQWEKRCADINLNRIINDQININTYVLLFVVLFVLCGEVVTL